MNCQQRFDVNNFGVNNLNRSLITFIFYIFRFIFIKLKKKKKLELKFKSCHITYSIPPHRPPPCSRSGSYYLGHNVQLNPAVHHLVPYQLGLSGPTIQSYPGRAISQQEHTFNHMIEAHRRPTGTNLQEI